MTKTHSGNALHITIPFNEIARAELVEINSTIKAWYEKQTDKPDYVITGTLFNRDDYAPCGTVIIGGEMVRNQGNGYGIGCAGGKIMGGRPWDRKWDWYYTGFPPMHVEGKKWTYSGFPTSVTHGITKRIAIGIDGDELHIISDTCNVSQLQSRYPMGWLMNNDGGGSAYILENGVPINNPTEDRKLANCVAIWLKREDKPVNYMEGRTTAKLLVYDKYGNREVGRYAGKGDVIRIDPTMTSNYLIKIEYPLAVGGWRTAYIKSLANITYP